MALPAAVILPDGREHPLAGDMTVGRDQSHDICLDDSTVSRRHAILAPRKGRWYVADTGSRNGTRLNGERVPPGVALQLRHADRIELGNAVLLFSSPAERDDPERTQTGFGADESDGLSPFQLGVVQCLCESWLDGGTLDRLPSNREIADRLGADGEDAVKASLRRAYAKLGLTNLPANEKRRELCRAARRRGWI